MRLEGDTEDVGVFFMLLYKTSFAKKKKFTSSVS